MRSVFIILSTGHIGGAEKRFAGLWRSFAEQGAEKKFRVFLVMNIALCEKLSEAGIIDPNHPNIIARQLSEKNFLTYRANIQKVIKEYSVKGDILHFIGYSPAIFFPSERMLISVTGSNLNIEGLKVKLTILLSIFLAGSVDVLDATVLKKLKRIFFWRRHTFHKTSNSFCNTQLYHPVPPGDKKNTIVFLGRFSPVKQVTQLLLSIPQIHDTLKKRYQEDFHFYFLGHGELEEELRKINSRPEFKSVNTHIYFEKFPFRVLNESKVFLSLQLHNNYPSRSLLEAMASGNIPLVTDNGDTRTIAKPEFSYYVPENFTADELEDRLVNIFSMTKEEFQRKAELARRLVLEEHTIEKMRAYYEYLYDRLI